ncbi:hypothetical protein OIV83_003637 [Microbotryomycetes sp. JL201]|nr:hypothetical protein OIV83_003637 [Microbotryomycetes sp. JL201]
MAWPYEIKGGVEIQFWNHLGHFAIVQELLPVLKETAKQPDAHVRIVNSNILFTKALQKRVDTDGIRCLSLHPGVIHSELLRGTAQTYGQLLGNIANYLSSLLSMTTYEGAKTQLYAATSPEVDELNLKGAYLTPIASVMTPSAYAQDPDLAESLWSLSERAVRDLSK